MIATPAALGLSILLCGAGLCESRRRLTAVASCAAALAPGAVYTAPPPAGKAKPDLGKLTGIPGLPPSEFLILILFKLALTRQLRSKAASPSQLQLDVSYEADLMFCAVGTFIFPNGTTCQNSGIGNIGCSNNGNFNLG